MSEKEINLVTLYNFMKDKFEQIDKRFEQIDRRFEQVDKRFDDIDARITKIDYNNQEDHKKLFEAIELNNNSLLKFEQTFSEKIAILFDAEKANRDRCSILSTQSVLQNEAQENLKLRVARLERLALIK